MSSNSQINKFENRDTVEVKPNKVKQQADPTSEIIPW